MVRPLILLDPALCSRTFSNSIPATAGTFVSAIAIPITRFSNLQRSSDRQTLRTFVPAIAIVPSCTSCCCCTYWSIRSEIASSKMATWPGIWFLRTWLWTFVPAIASCTGSCTSVFIFNKIPSLSPIRSCHYHLEDQNQQKATSITFCGSSETVAPSLSCSFLFKIRP
jgi:hypothetical protein